MDRYAVVGNPVAHSLSPAIHAVFAKATGQDLVYETLLAPVDGFAATVGAFFAGGGAGLNVTVPFKAEAAAWVDELDPAAQAAGAVNTIVPAATGFRGCNTDGAGLIRDLTGRGGARLAGSRLLLLGAGGAARGAAGPLLDAGPASLTIGNRSAARARDLAAELAARHDAVAITGVSLADIEGEFDVIVNATSAGLDGDRVPDVDPAAIRGALCYDMIYVTGADGLTAFCRWAAGAGAGAVLDGLGMLVEQAALAFELWRGMAPPTAPALAAVEHLRRREAG